MGDNLSLLIGSMREVKKRSREEIRMTERKRKKISSAKLLFANNIKQPPPPQQTTTTKSTQEQEARDNNSTHLDLIRCLTIDLADHHVNAR